MAEDKKQKVTELPCLYQVARHPFW